MKSLSSTSYVPPQTRQLCPVTLATPRLRLRRGRADDALPLFSGYFSSVEASTFLGRRPYSAVEQAQRFLERWCDRGWSEGGTFAWVIAAKSNDTPLGIVLVIADQHKAEIHYGLSPSASGVGYATEAVVTTTHWMLNQGLQRVWTAVDLEHVASQRVLEKAGYGREGVLRRWATLPTFGAEARDAIAYSRTAK